MAKRSLRILAATLILAALGLWLARGANRGWTKTSVPVKRTDEITGIAVDDYKKSFVPGLDFRCRCRARFEPARRSLLPIP